jgi:4-hydroxy-tetrahydrodipicolinate reductase
MKIFLFGYGQMGQEIEQLALSNGHQIIGKADPVKNLPLLLDELKIADVAIDYSTPVTVFENIKSALQAGIPVVVGTTGWYGRLEEVLALCKEFNGTLFYSPNFSIGMNIFFRLNQLLAKMMAKQEGYRLHAYEKHHIRKKDAPSGTALKLVNDILATNTQYDTWATYPEGNVEKVEPGTIPVYFSREGDEVGLHNIHYKSDADEIKIHHRAFNRQGFAIGTLIASLWILNKKGVFTMDNLLMDL